MTVLLAREIAPGRFSKVLVFRARKDGKGPLAEKWCGSVESLAVRSAAQFFAGEGKARTVFQEFGRQKFRCDLVD